ncbi:hypothetical protein K445DRAFT_243233 [Daldinia sp. EC12]|nr:hypothetical protein K445DRAFT_243233 [Daldinia sp. EC12]
MSIQDEQGAIGLLEWIIHAFMIMGAAAFSIQYLVMSVENELRVVIYHTQTRRALGGRARGV